MNAKGGSSIEYDVILTSCKQLSADQSAAENLDDSVFVARCLPNGAYSNTQCSADGHCWCVDSTGQIVTDSAVFQGNPHCQPDSLQTESACRVEQDLSGNLPGAFNPKCNADGSYGMVQCWASTGYCWCVDTTGQEVSNTRVRFAQPVCNVINRARSGTYHHAAVAADNERCSSIGTDFLLIKNGSVVDAAIAVMLCLGIVNSQHTGIGGGFYAMIYETPTIGGQRQLTCLNARETAPLWATQNMFDSAPNMAATGTTSINIPGEVRGYHEAWKKFGRLPWSDLFQPAIQMARGGWVVSQSMAVSIASDLVNINLDPGLKELLVKRDGSPYVAGDTMTNIKMANTLQRIADNPTDYYQGQLAQDIINDLADLGVPQFTKADLQTYAATFSDPIEMHLNNGDYYVYTTPPPSGGLLTQFILGMMDGYQYKPSDVNTTADWVLFYHRMIESWKLAFGRQNFVGDKDFMTPDQKQRANQLGDPSYISRVRSLINDNNVLTDYGPGATGVTMQPGGTTHIAITSPGGSALSATPTVGSLFGCKRRGNRTGIIFNNGFSLFTVPANTAAVNNPNLIMPQKHGRSMTSPLIVMDNTKQRVVLLAGGSGGQRIVTSTSLITACNLWLNMSVADAVSKPRLHNQLSPNMLYYDNIDQEILSALRAKGQVPQTPTMPALPYLGVVQAVKVTGCSTCSSGKSIEAVSDWRKGSDSAPDGY